MKNKIFLLFILFFPLIGYASDKQQEILSLWKNNEKKKAESLLKVWMGDQKKSAEPWVMAAQFRCEEEQYKKCLSMAQAALDRSASAADAYYWKGRAFEKLGKPMDAANELKAALLANTTQPDAQDRLDQVLSGLDQ